MLSGFDERAEKIDKNEYLYQRGYLVDEIAQKGRLKAQNAIKDFDQQLDALLPFPGSQSESWQLKQLRASLGHTGKATATRDHLAFFSHATSSQHVRGENIGACTTTIGKSSDHNKSQVELYWNENRLIWSVAGIAVRTFSFEEVIRYACWAWLDMQDTGEEDERELSRRRKTQRALCIFLQSSMIIQFPQTGQEYVKRLDFEVMKVLPLKIGILVQRLSEREDQKRYETSYGDRDIDLDEIFQDKPLPNLFYLRRPFDELKPVQVVEEIAFEKRKNDEALMPICLTKDPSKLFNSIDERVVNVHNVTTQNSSAFDILITMCDERRIVRVYTLIHSAKPLTVQESGGRSSSGIHPSSNPTNGVHQKRPRLSSATRGRTPSHRRTSRLEAGPRSSSVTGQSMRMSMGEGGIGQKVSGSIIERSRMSSGGNQARLNGRGLPSIYNAGRREDADVQMEEVDGFRQAMQLIDGFDELEENEETNQNPRQSQTVARIPHTSMRRRSSRIHSNLSHGPSTTQAALLNNTVSLPNTMSHIMRTPFSKGTIHNGEDLLASQPRMSSGKHIPNTPAMNHDPFLVTENGFAAPSMAATLSQKDEASKVAQNESHLYRSIIMLGGGSVNSKLPAMDSQVDDGQGMEEGMSRLPLFDQFGSGYAAVCRIDELKFDLTERDHNVQTSIRQSADDSIILSISISSQKKPTERIIKSKFLADGKKHVDVSKDRGLTDDHSQPHVASAIVHDNSLMRDITDASFIHLGTEQASRIHQKLDDMKRNELPDGKDVWQTFCSVFVQERRAQSPLVSDKEDEEIAWGRMLLSASKEDLLLSKGLPALSTLREDDECFTTKAQASLDEGLNHASSIQMLNLIAQDIRLDIRRLSKDLDRIGRLILSIAIECEWTKWISYWSSIIGVKCSFENSSKNDEPLLYDIYDDFRHLLLGQSPADPDLILRPRSSRIRSVYKAITGPFKNVKLMSGRVCSNMEARSHKVVEAMIANDIDEGFLQNVPLPIALPMLEACHAVRFDPPLFWSQKAYNLVGRPDLALQLCRRTPDNIERSRKDDNNGMDKAKRNVQRGNTPVLPDICFQLFNKDHRLTDVSNMLQTHRAVATRGPVEASTAGNPVDEEVMAEQQKRVFVSISDRLKATSVGRAMFLLSSQPIQMAKQLKISPICLRIRMLCHCIVTHREPDGESAEMEWPEFHNGVSAALMLAMDDTQVESSWIYSQTSSGFNSRHAGFIFGLGLQGQLRNLGKIHAHHYLSNRHLTTTIGLLLGIAISFVGSCDVMAKALMSIHLIHTLPTHSKPLKTSMLEQSAALVGLGFVFLGSYDAWASRMALRALGTDLVMTDDNQMLRRESFSLSAGFALGLICLGKGKEHKTSIEIEREIVPFLERAIKQCSSSARGTNKMNNFPSSRNPKNFAAFEWRPEVSLTTTPATIALALIYLRSNRADIAAKLALPEHISDLDEIRPDILQIRILCRSLIMWNEIEPSQKWLQNILPSFLQDFDPSSSQDAAENVQLAFWNMRIGEIFAIGLKFAGTNDYRAKECLLHQLSLIQSKAEVRPITFFDKLRQQILRSAIDTALTSLAIVNAGSGDVEIMKLIRKTLFQMGQMRYGNYMASTMAMGMLFLGGGRFTLASSDVAIASILISFFPLYPINAQDNRADLQAYRHFWILAVESRLLSVKDVQSSETSRTPIDILLTGSKKNQSVEEVQLSSTSTPCVLPEMQQIDTIRIASDRYLQTAIDVKSNKKHRRALLESQTMFAMKRLACLSHEKDAHGCASLIEQRKGSQMEFISPFFSVQHLSLAMIRSWQLESESLVAILRTSVDQPMVTVALDTIFGKFSCIDERNKDLYDIAKEVRLQLFMVQSLSHCLCEDKLDIWSQLLLLYTKAHDLIRLNPSREKEKIKMEDRIFLMDLAYLYHNQVQIGSLFHDKTQSGLIPENFLTRLFYGMEEMIAKE